MSAMSFPGSDSENALEFVRRQIAELRAFRYMLQNLVTGEIRHRYHGSPLGFMWALLNPLAFLVVLTVFFSLVLNVNVIDYSAFVFSGKIPWTFVQAVLLGGPGVYRAAEGYVKRVYVSKLAFPIARVCVELIHFVLIFVAFYLLQLVIGLRPSPALLLLPVAIALLSIFLLGVCLLVGVGSVYFHDLHHIMHVFDTVLIYTMPMIYHIEAIPAHLRHWFDWHPFYAFIKFFRAIVYHGRLPMTDEWLPALGIALGTLFVGLAVFKWREHDLVYRM